jgi:hypothetical protein
MLWIEVLNVRSTVAVVAFAKTSDSVVFVIAKPLD